MIGKAKETSPNHCIDDICWMLMAEANVNIYDVDDENGYICCQHSNHVIYVTYDMLSIIIHSWRDPASTWMYLILSDIRSLLVISENHAKCL